MVGRGLGPEFRSLKGCGTRGRYLRGSLICLMELREAALTAGEGVHRK